MKSVWVIVCVLCVCLADFDVQESVPLHHTANPGLRMPSMGIGVGAYGTPDGKYGEHWNDTVCYEAVTKFFNAGGRRVDTSLKWYNDLPGVGKALQDTTIDRKEIFITSKVDDPYGYEPTLKHIEEIHKILGGESFELVLMHWAAPLDWDFTTSTVDTTKVYVQACGTPKQCRIDTYRAMIDAWKKGLVKAVGVSNFEPRHLQDLIDAKLPLPSVVQNEYNIYWKEDDWVQKMQAQNITVNSYSPLGAPDFMAFLPSKWPTLPKDQPAIQSIASSIGKSPSQVMLRWALQKGIVVNPRTWNETHMKENLEVFSFSLTPAQMKTIDAIPHPLRNKVCPDPGLLA